LIADPKLKRTGIKEEKEDQMKKIILSMTVLAMVIFAGSALAQDSMGHSLKAVVHSGQSIKNSALAVGHGSLAGAKFTSGVIAAPFKVVGGLSAAAGHVSNQMGDDLWSAAAGKSFEVTDQNLTAAGLPPHQAIQE